MNIWQVLLDVVILLGVGALLGGLVERARQSAILGYLLAGALLGPNALHLVQNGDEVLAVSELGVALLLFTIGLEFSWSRLRAMGRFAFGSGFVQVSVTVALGTIAGLAMGFSLGGSIALGAICALSSTACVLRLLTTRGELESAHGDRALGILLVQDMAVVPLVLLVSVLAEGGSAPEMIWAVARTAGIAGGLIVGLYVVFNYGVPRLLGTGPMQTNRELPLLIAVVSGLGSALFAHSVGVSPALGAFVAGLLLAESPFATQVRADIASLKTLLLTLFFTAIGMLTDPEWILSNAALVGIVIVVVILGKSLIAWGALRLFRSPGQTAIAAGLCLGQLGEFSFVLASIAHETLLDGHTFMLVVSTTVITMALTPTLVSRAPQLAARLSGTGLLSRRTGTDDSLEPSAVLIIGYGPAGRAAAEHIAKAGGHVVIVDQNPAAAREARGLGYRFVTGDARYAEVLDEAGLRNASFVVVTVPGEAVAQTIVSQVRQRAPSVQILARARFHRSLPDLIAAGAHAAIDEEHEVGRLVADAYVRMANLQDPNEPVAPE